MSPESSPESAAPIISEVPVSAESVYVIPSAPVEMITVPEAIQTSVEEARAEAAQALTDSAAEAAKRIIREAPGYTAVPAETAPVQTENGFGGKFDRGVIPTAMPADPSHVVGWTGEVRH